MDRNKWVNKIEYKRVRPSWKVSPLLLKISPPSSVSSPLSLVFRVTFVRVTVHFYTKTLHTVVKTSVLRRRRRGVHWYTWTREVYKYKKSLVTKKKKKISLWYPRSHNLKFPQIPFLLLLLFTRPFFRSTKKKKSYPNGLKVNLPRFLKATNGTPSDYRFVLIQLNMSSCFWKSTTGDGDSRPTTS